MSNTKKRHLEILGAAADVLEENGGVSVIDELPKDDRILKLRQMTAEVKERSGCHIDTAKRNLAKAMRRARFALMKQAVPDRWGGKRNPSGGRPTNHLTK